MADNTTASLTVSFQAVIVDEDGEIIDGDGSGTYLSVEVNSEDNDEKTSFVFGDIVKYRVHKTSNITSLSVVVSDGSEGSVSVGNTETLSEVVTFNGETANSSSFISSLTSSSRIAAYDLGSISKVGPTTVKCSKVSAGPADPLVGVYRINYETKYDIRKLYGVSQPTGFGDDGFDSYPVVVIVIGTVTS